MHVHKAWALQETCCIDSSSAANRRAALAQVVHGTIAAVVVLHAFSGWLEFNIRCVLSCLASIHYKFLALQIFCMNIVLRGKM